MTNRTASHDTTGIKLGEEVFHDGPYKHQSIEGKMLPRDFFGHQKEKAEILRHLTEVDPRQAVIVQGERRMGKTSMLRLIEAELREKHQGDIIVPQLLMIAHISDAATLFAEMVAILADALGLSQVDPETTNGPFNAVQARICLERLVREHAPGKTVVFIMDEVDECLEGERTTPTERAHLLGLFGALRQPGTLIKLLFSVIRIPARYLYKEVETFVLDAKLIPLKPLENDPEFEAMIRILADPDQMLTADEIAEIHRQAGGWPYFAKVILVYLIQSPGGPAWLQRAINEAARDSKDMRLTYAMKHVYKHHLDEAERRLCIMLAEGVVPLTLDELTSKDPVDAALLGAGQRLEGRCYLQLRDNAYCFAVALLGPWFRNSGLIATQHASPERVLLADRDGGEPASGRKRFRIALSYASEHGDFVEKVAADLCKRFEQWQILYAPYHEVELARTDIGIYLPTLYHDHSELVVVFLCENYVKKRWPGKLEWAAAHDMSMRKPESVLVIEMDGVKPPGVWSGGTVELNDRSPKEIAGMIIRRYEQDVQRSSGPP